MMNFYDMMKSGMSEAEVMKAIQEELTSAKLAIAQDEEKARAAEEAKVKAQEHEASIAALKAEARAHIVNAILAYADAFELDFSPAEEDLKEFEETIIEMEGQITALIPMLKSLNELEKLKDENNQKNTDKSKKIFEVSTKISPEDANKIIEEFLKGLN